MKLSSASSKEVIEIGYDVELSFHEFYAALFEGRALKVSAASHERLVETRRFIEALLERNEKVYGLTTGFADLRNYSISPENAAELSKNIIVSHDAGTGKSLSEEVVLGAMILRAHSLAQGYSGFQPESLQTLVEMINHKVIPLIPESGSLGASGDLAYLARLGRAMQGHDVPVRYLGEITTATAALKKAGISPFDPQAKEGLALTNGTSFMASMIAIGYMHQVQAFENILACQVLFLNSVEAIDAAFKESIHTVRKQKGQSAIAEILSQALESAPFIDRTGVQNDYCIRCLPQLFGPRYETILEQYPKVRAELNAVTDNPLLFRGDEISADIGSERIFDQQGEKWAVLSGGNFHGEYLTSVADSLLAVNAKLALTLERQITYMMNPSRNRDVLPAYLLQNQKKIGLHSGYMITQYTANALAQKIAQLAVPCSMFNITSANESEDVVSYGATAAQKLMEQLDLLHQFNSIYLTVVAQAYGIRRSGMPSLAPELLSERLFAAIQEASGSCYPTSEEDAFEKRYELSSRVLRSGSLRSLIQNPLMAELQ